MDVADFVVFFFIAATGLCTGSSWWLARRTPLQERSYWLAIQAIERRHPDDARLSFHARTARLVWYAVTQGRYAVHFDLLWQTPEGAWFYVNATLGRDRLGRNTRSFRPERVAVQMLTPRRAYNALLGHTDILAREFPAGRPSDATPVD